MKNISVSSLQQQEHSCTQSFWAGDASIMNELNYTPTQNGLSSDSDSQSPAAEIVEPAELTSDEQSDRLFLERKVERVFYEAGKALTELRSRRLYRSTHSTFEEYCRDRFGHSRQKSNYLIAAASVYDNLTTNCCQKLEVDDLTTNGSQILPTSESQVRSRSVPQVSLTQLEPEQQCLDFKPQIVHFSGHGAGDDGLELEDETGKMKLVSTEALARLFELFVTDVECVVLNACYSEVQASAIAKIRFIFHPHLPALYIASKNLRSSKSIPARP